MKLLAERLPEQVSSRAQDIPTERGGIVPAGPTTVPDRPLACPPSDRSGQIFVLPAQFLYVVLYSNSSRTVKAA